MPTNPKYYLRMSELLNDLVKRRKQEDVEYREYLAQIVTLTKQVKDPAQSGRYPAMIDTQAKRALYDNLGDDEKKALVVHEAVVSSRSDGFRGHPIKERAIKIAIKEHLPEFDDEAIKNLFEIIKNQNEY